MTWRHVLLIIASFAVVVVCAHSGQCSQALPSVFTLATTIIGGVLGHAGANSFTGKISLDKNSNGIGNVDVRTHVKTDSGENPTMKGTP